MRIDASPLLHRFARWRAAKLAGEDAAVSQRRELARLLQAARGTRFGRDHGFGAIATVEDYQRAVPLRRYDDFWNGYWGSAYPVLDNLTWPGLIPFFANSSGTSSGVTKHIPVSAAMTRSNRRAAIDLMVHHVLNRPQSRMLGGMNFFLGGSAELTALAPGVSGGDLSGIAAAGVPLWAKGFYFPSGAPARLTDWEEKVRTLARLSLQEDIRSLSGTPSWLLLFLDEVKKQAGRGTRLSDWWPNLEMLTHGGVSFEPYRARFGELLAGGHAETREVFPASEGFMALADRGPGEGLRLLTGNGIFFEFVPVAELDSPSPTRHWIGNAETGINYAIVLTTCAGLWSYVIGDTVRLIDLAPPRLKVTGRTSYGLSAFGEHLIGEEIDKAVAAAAHAVDGVIADYMVGPVIPVNGVGHHLYLVEFTEAVPQRALAVFSGRLDDALKALNVDYAEHRAGDYGMAAPQVRFVKPGSFAAWMKARGKLGGQNKVPRVIADAEQFAAAAAAIGQD
jgi:hypothetical protein